MQRGDAESVSDGGAEKYLLYDHKAGTEDSGESSLQKLRAQMQEIGYTVAVGRGDFTGGRDA